ncbi:MAG: hypothetical protein KBT31_03885, partial [Firmicutes bacterium]|nr:hypothetical protein [Candidatus Colimorpha enterica]
IYVIFWAFGICSFDPKTFIKSFLPIAFKKWWFASTYFVLYIIHPFLNVLLRNVNKKTYQALLVMLVIMWSVIPTFTTLSYQSSNLLWFIVLYAIAGYIRLFGLNSLFTTKHYFWFWFTFSFLTYASCVVFTFLGTKWEVFANYSAYFYGQEKLTVLLISLSLFMLFKTVKMNNHKWINVIASATFGVYLIHDNNLVRSFLWRDLFKNSQYQSTLLIIPYSIIIVALVYAVCTAIDLIRQKVFEKPFMLLVNKYTDMVLKPFDAICSFFKKIVFGQE